MSRTMGYLRIMECDPKPLGGDGRELGGAGFTTVRETRQRFDAVPGMEPPSEDEYEYLLDRLDANGDLTDDTKTISLETALALLGGSLHELRVRAEAKKVADSAGLSWTYQPVFVEGTEERAR